VGKWANLVDYLGFGTTDPAGLPSIVPESDVERAHLGEVSEHAIQLLGELRAKMLEQGQATFRWLLASLLTLNAGAIGLIVGSGWFERGEAEPAIISFVAGCVLAILTGLASAIGPMFLNGSISELTEQLMLNMRRGMISSQSRAEAQKLTRRAVTLTGTVIVIGSASLLSFCIGIGLLI
jgi:hypothetical protein